MRPAFFWSPHYEMDIGKHVFPTEKFRLAKELAIAKNLLSESEIQRSPKAFDEDLLLVLTREYLQDLRSYRHTDRTRKSELPITEEIVEAMIYTSGGTIECVRAAMKRGLACHFGGGYHHGHGDHGEGFCYINDIAVAAAVALRDGLCKRIAIVDLDTHQGNGTARIFADNPNVYTLSIHDDTIYPKVKARSDMDIGLPRDPGEDVYTEALERGLTAAIDEFKPDLVIYAAGVDPYEDDVLGKLRLSSDYLGVRDRMVAERTLRQGIPLVTVVAGGYARSLEDTVRLHVQTVEVALDVYTQLGTV